MYRKIYTHKRQVSKNSYKNTALESCHTKSEFSCHYQFQFDSGQVFHYIENREQSITVSKRICLSSLNVITTKYPEN